MSPRVTAGSFFSIFLTFISFGAVCLPCPDCSILKCSVGTTQWRCRRSRRRREWRWTRGRQPIVNRVPIIYACRFCWFFATAQKKCRTPNVVAWNNHTATPSSSQCRLVSLLVLNVAVLSQRNLRRNLCPNQRYLCALWNNGNLLVVCWGARAITKKKYERNYGREC